MAPRTRSHDPGRKHTGTWPNGESQKTRDAYDAILAKEAADKKTGQAPTKP